MSLYVAHGSKLGIHAQEDRKILFEHLDQAVEQGAPLPMVKTTQGHTRLKEVKRRSPQTWTMARAIAVTDGMGGVEDISDEEVEVWADWVLEPLYEFAILNPDFEEWVDIWELINEANPNGDRGWLMLGKVMRRCAERIAEDFPDLKVGIASANMGTPEYSQMVAFAESGVFELDNVVLCLHEGVPQPDDPVNKWHSSESDDPDAGLIPGAPSVPEHAGALYGRVVYWHLILGDENMPPVVISEAYLHAYGDHEEVRRRVEWVDELYSNLWYVVAFLPFTYAPTERWEKQDYTPSYDELLKHVVSVADRENAPLPDGKEEPEEPMDWRDEAILVSDALRKATGINWNPDHGYPRWAVQQPGHYSPTHTEYRFTAQDGTVVTVQGFSDLSGEGPDKYLVYDGGWRGMDNVEVLTKGDPILFSMPVGTREERESGVYPPGDWNDANPYGNYYKLRDGFAYHTGSDLNLNKPHWDADRGQPVYAIRGGEVTFAGHLDVWGNVIVIRHDPLPDGRVPYSRSAHVDKMFVEKGERVSRGDAIATIGQDEGGGPYHLHFDISLTDVLAEKPWDWPGLTWTRVERDYVDPKPFLENQGKVKAPAEPGLTRVVATDVSHHNSPIDFSKMLSRGVVACYVRSSIGGAGLDNAFVDNWEAVQETPLKRGMYHLFKSTSTAEENLHNLIRTVREHGHGGLRIAIDVEPVQGNRVNGDEVARFWPMFEEAFGYEPLTYTALWVQRHIDGDQSWMNRNLLWLAWYLDEPPAEDYYPPIPIGARRSSLLMHQWTSSYYDGRDWGAAGPGLDVNIVYDLNRLLIDPVTPPLPAVDLLPYLRPGSDSPLYELRRQTGAQERVQTRVEIPVWYYTKGSGGLEGKAEWEELKADGQWIYRSIDTSPGDGKFYELRDEADAKWSRWAPRYMAIGQSHTRNPLVIFRRKSDCQETLRNRQETAVKLEAVYDQWTSPQNERITLNSVAQVAVFHDDGRLFERYWYAAGYGLVGFVGESVTSFISEIHEPGARPDNEREHIGCLEQS